MPLPPEGSFVKGSGFLSQYCLARPYVLKVNNLLRNYGLLSYLSFFYKNNNLFLVYSVDFNFVTLYVCVMIAVQIRI